ncbi:MAG: recombinase family protein [Gemmataceae bacterium]
MSNKIEAVYVRKSSDPQEEVSQIEAIKDYLERLGIVVVDHNWFVEVGQRHRPEDRPKFQHLMRMVEANKVSRVFVWKQNRVVSGVKLWFKYLYEFEASGTKLIDVMTGIDLASDDVAVEITTTIAARKARDDVRQLAEDVMRARVSLAKEGMPQSKQAPFGYDKLYSDSKGQHLWTTHLLDNGRYLVINPDGSTVIRERSPRKVKTDRIRYVPSHDTARVEVLKTIFATYATEAISERQIALRLNTAGKLHYGRPWIRTTILELLRNPSYIGSVRNLSHQQAEFATYDGTKISKAVNPDRKTTKTPDRAIIVPGKHDALIDPTTWEAVQTKLATRKRRQQPPRREDLWLRGVLTCGKCGVPMHTFTGAGKKVGYICASYYYFNQTHAVKYDTGCTRNFVSHERAEELIRTKVGEILKESKEDSGALELSLLATQADIQEMTLAKIINKGIIEYIDHLQDVVKEAGGEDGAIDRITKKIKGMEGITAKKADLLKTLAAKDDLFTPEAFQRYFLVFEQEKTTAARKKTNALQTEYDDWLRAKVHASSDRERERINERLKTLDSDIVKWEALTVPLDDQLAKVRGRLADYRHQLAATSKVLGGNENLRKAELVRRMFSKIVIHHRVIQKAKIRDCEFQPEKTEFVSNHDDGSSSQTPRASWLAGRGSRSRAGFR